ncbi:MAG: lysine exporter LysO family protein [Thermoproteus sp.]
MELAAEMAQYIASMGLGYLAGRRLGLRVPPAVFTAVVAAVIFSASAEGAHVVVDNAGYIVALSLGYALSVALASMLPFALSSRGRGAQSPSGSGVSAVAVSALLAGIAVGYFVQAPYASAIEPILLVLLFLAGADIGRLKGLRLSPRLAAVPLVSLASSLAAGLAFYLWLGVSPAVAVGMGWYSFTGPYLLSASGDAVLGTLGFLANFFREQLTFVLTPLLADRVRPDAALAIGGATTMDNTLPLYRSVYGAEAVVPAVVNGVVLTLAVPIVVPLVYSLFP